MAKNTIADLDTTTSNNTDVLGQSTAGSASANQLDAVDRATLALLARFYADLGGMVTVGGSANAITVTSASTYQALETGLVISFKAGSANTGATTLNLDSLGAKAVRLKGDTALTGGEIAANGRYTVVYDAAYNSAAGAWVLMNPEAVAAAVPSTVELGGTTDTTLSRAAAGVLAVEGNQVPSPASQATGDILYRGASSWARLAKGSDGQVLTLASGLPAWDDVATGGMTLLGTLTTTSGSTASLTSIPSGYRSLRCEIVGVSCSSASYLQLALSSTNGAAYGTAGVIVSAALAAASNTLSGIVDVVGIWSTVASVKLASSSLVESSGTLRGAEVATPTNTAAVVDAIQFSWASGNFDGGAIRVYGVS